MYLYGGGGRVTGPAHPALFRRKFDPVAPVGGFRPPYFFALFLSSCLLLLSPIVFFTLSSFFLAPAFTL